MKVRWQFYLGRGTTPLCGSIEIEDDASDEEIEAAVFEAVADQTTARITWERESKN
jgi:hypothetical protein